MTVEEALDRMLECVRANQYSQIIVDLLEEEAEKIMDEIKAENSQFGVGA